MIDNSKEYRDIIDNMSQEQLDLINTIQNNEK